MLRCKRARLQDRSAAPHALKLFKSLIWVLPANAEGTLKRNRKLQICILNIDIIEKPE